MADATELLDQIVDKQLLTAHAVLDLVPAYASGDDVIVTHDESAIRIPFLRQQMRRSNGQPNRCLADFIAPRHVDIQDHIGMFAVTAGHGLDDLVARFESEHDDYSAIMVKALADRLAEALAEYLHLQVRRHYWGYETGEPASSEDLISENYRGIRPAPGYPACPDHSTKSLIFDVLDVPSTIGVHLTDSYAMTPTASVSGFYFAHPDTRYFGIGRISADQVEDYARRAGVTRDQAGSRLAPVVG